MSAAIFILLLQTVVHTSGPPPAPPQVTPTERGAHPEALVYFAGRNAQADVDAALSDAKISAKTVLIVMGGNWCHDSIGLAGRLNSPRFTAMMRDKFNVVYVDAGRPQTGKGRNLDIAKRFGISRLKGTPLVMLVSADGRLLNRKKDAASWRNAASRSEDEIFGYFSAFTPA